jgi:hypothetical protein
MATRRYRFAFTFVDLTATEEAGLADILDEHDTPETILDSLATSTLVVLTDDERLAGALDRFIGGVGVLCGRA